MHVVHMQFPHILPSTNSFCSTPSFKIPCRGFPVVTALTQFLIVNLTEFQSFTRLESSFLSHIPTSGSQP